jgi:hypothetical protein
MHRAKPGHAGRQGKTQHPAQQGNLQQRREMIDSAMTRAMKVILP